MLVEVPSMNLQVGDIIYISFIPFQSKSKHRNRFCYTFLTRTWKRMTSYPVTPCFSTRVDREEIVSFAYGNMRGLIPQTSNIDGESDLKVRKVPPQLYSRLQGKTQDEIHQVLNSLSLEIFCGRPDCHLYQFDARYENRWNAMQFVHRPVHERQSFRAEPASASHPAAIHAIRVLPFNLSDR